MTSTTETGSADEMSALEVRETLLAAAAERRQADRSEARLLALAVQIVHLHPVEDHTPVASWDDPLLTIPDDDDPISDHLAGTGTPQVAERAVEELAAALDLSYRSGCGLVADSLELSYRLPRLWALVQAGVLQAWKARKVAQHTTHLGAQTVAFVDAQAAIAGAKNRLVPNLPGLIHQALIRFEPDVARAREEAAQTHREVRFDYHGETTGCPGSATLTAELDLVDGLDLDAAVADLADHLGRLGDTDPSTSAGPAPSACSPTPKQSSTSTPSPTEPDRARPRHRHGEPAQDGAGAAGHHQHQDQHHGRHALPPPRRRRPPPPHPGRRPHPRHGREARCRQPRGSSRPGSAGPTASPSSPSST